MAFSVGAFIGTFVVFLGVAVIWLLIAKAIPPLQRQPRVANIVAGTLVWLLALVGFTDGAPLGTYIVCALLMTGILTWNYRRDLAALKSRQTEAGRAVVK